MSDSIEVPALIVGAGPVGLATAHLLAADGRHCLLVERRDRPQRQPAAHVVNARTLEILRQAGLDMDAIAAVAEDPDQAGHVNYVTTLAGELIGRLPFERQGPEVLDLTPTPLRNISQHDLEPILADAAVARSEIELRYSTEWVSSTQDDDGVTSVLRRTDTGEELQVRSRWLIAADGAASPIRKSVGIDMVGPPRLASYVAIHLAADFRDVVSGRSGVLHFVMDPGVSGVFIAHGADREWVYMVAYDPDRESVDDYDTERCAAIVRRALGDAEVPFEVLGAGTWHMSAQVAESFRSGRIFLVGDSSHRFPPTGGMGLNTGVADAQGLVWRLTAVDDGWADPGVLEGYQSERRPVAQANCDQSLANAMKIGSLFEALDLGHAATPESLRATLADPDRRPAIATAVEEQATHFDMIGLQLGYSYAHDAPPIEDPRVFAPDAAVGTRLPHGWLDDGRSTLDLIGPGTFTLLTTGAHDTWATITDGAAVPVRHVRLGIDATVDAKWIATCHLAAGGALLVRPDQHVAWRADSPSDLPAAGLDGAAASVVGR